MTVDEQRIVDRLNAAIKDLNFKITMRLSGWLQIYALSDNRTSGEEWEWIYGSWDSINKMFFGATSMFVLMCNELKICKISNLQLNIDRYQHLVNILNAIRGDCIEEMLLKMDMMGI